MVSHEARIEQLNAEYLAQDELDIWRALKNELVRLTCLAIDTDPARANDLKFLEQIRQCARKDGLSAYYFSRLLKRLGVLDSDEFSAALAQTKRIRKAMHHAW